MRGKNYPEFHGSPWRSGRVDAYYDRPKDPHWYPEGSSYNGRRIPESEMTVEEIEAYHYGYDNYQAGKKD